MARASETLLLTLGLALPGPLMAQHGPDVLPGGCPSCHEPHGAATPGGYNLKVGDARPWLSGSGQLGVISLSCLRCHSSQRLRASQADAAEISLSLTGGRYLGFDLGTQHPLGAIEAILSQRDASIADRRDWGSRSPLVLRGIEAVECTSCHGAHDRLAVEAKRPVEARCLECHEAPAYRTSHANQDCGVCHDVHRRDPGRQLIAGPGSDAPCRDCHLGGKASLVAVTSGSRRAPGASSPDPHIGGAPCLGCHTLHR